MVHKASTWLGCSVHVISTTFARRPCGQDDVVKSGMKSNTNCAPDVANHSFIFQLFLSERKPCVMIGSQISAQRNISWEIFIRANCKVQSVVKIKLPNVAKVQCMHIWTKLEKTSIGHDLVKCLWCLDWSVASFVDGLSSRLQWVCGFPWVWILMGMGSVISPFGLMEILWRFFQWMWE